MRRWLAHAAALVTLCSAGAAQANWEYTSWGMKVDEVLAAANGQAVKLEDREDARIWSQQRLAEASFAQDGITYTVGFYFDRKSKRLTLIDLTLDAASCETAYAALTDRLGKGEEDRRASQSGPNGTQIVAIATKWQSEDSDELVQFSDLTMPPSDFRYCKILYMAHPLGPA